MTEKFRQSMAALGLNGSEDIAVAVSGGGDSMALALMLKWFCKGKLLALTVDHGLRPESRTEAEKTGAALAGAGISHRILTWTGEKPGTHIQERAREARYDLLLKECVRENIKVLAVAHNAEDQMETFWMRLSHGSGLDGLAGMAARRTVAGVDIIRPLLGYSRAELRDYCRSQNIGWVDDPSNENTKYLRVRLRQFEDVLAAEGLTSARLALTVQKLRQSRDALEWLSGEALRDCVLDGVIDRARFLRYPEDTRQRVLVAVIQAVAPRDYAPGFEGLARLSAAVVEEGFTGCTLGGCIFAPDKAGIRVMAEKSSG